MIISCGAGKLHVLMLSTHALSHPRAIKARALKRLVGACQVAGAYTKSWQQTRYCVRVLVLSFMSR